MNAKKLRYAIVIVFTCVSVSSMAQTDTLRVMAYNVLYYGNGCQGPTANYHGYLRTIVSYTNPDILSLEKMASIPVSAADKYGTAPVGFADSIVRYALSPAYAGRYAYCPFTNNAHNSSMAVLFYDRRKLGYLATVSSYANVTDFNTYKLYYKDPNLARTHDTTFLYVIPNHDMSGDENDGVRGAQITGVMNNIKAHFSHLPNMIDMGDFNVRNSGESFYQTLTNATDTGFRFYDPPFFPDRKFAYPANWDHNGAFGAYFTTSTRESANVPNSCGTGGGGKNWYDHIFLSSWIVNNIDLIRYIPNSYRTIGNDGQRYKVSINNGNTHANSSAPADVIEALYQMSNKYPVMADLEVMQNKDGKGIANTEIMGSSDKKAGMVTIDATVVDRNLVMHFPEDMMGQEITIDIFDAAGGLQTTKHSKVSGTTVSVGCKLKPGNYTVKLTGHHNLIAEAQLTKQ